MPEKTIQMVKHKIFITSILQKLHLFLFLRSLSLPLTLAINFWIFTVFYFTITCDTQSCKFCDCALLFFIFSQQIFYLGPVGRSWYVWWIAFPWYNIYLMFSVPVHVLFWIMASGKSGQNIIPISCVLKREVFFVGYDEIKTRDCLDIF